MDSLSLERSQRAIKISLACIGVILILGSIGIWIMLNQITATASMSHKLHELEQRLEKLETLKADSTQP